MSHEEYQTVMKEYWKDLKNKRQAVGEEEKRKAIDFRTMLSMKTDDMSKEDYEKAKKNFFKLKGYKHIDDFSADERKAIVEDSAVNLMGKEKLSQKYNTFAFVITRIVRMAGLTVTPDNLSRFPDYPKKSDDMSQEEYKTVIKKYWKSKKNKNEKENAKEKKKAVDDRNDYPKRTDDVSKEDYEEARNNFFKLKFYKHIGDFSADEKNAIIEDCTVKLIGPKKLSEKYNTLAFVINQIVRNAGLPMTPNDLSKFPDYPLKSDGMSEEEYKTVVIKYWKAKKNKRAKEGCKEQIKCLALENHKKILTSV